MCFNYLFNVSYPHLIICWWNYLLCWVIILPDFEKRWSYNTSFSASGGASNLPSHQPGCATSPWCCAQQAIFSPMYLSGLRWSADIDNTPEYRFSLPTHSRSQLSMSLRLLCQTSVCSRVLWSLFWGGVGVGRALCCAALRFLFWWCFCILQVYDYEGAGVGMAMYNTDAVSRYIWRIYIYIYLYMVCGNYHCGVYPQ